MLVSKEDLHSFIPQQFPFVMVDHLISAKGNVFKTSFRPAADNVLVDNGCFSEAGIIENIAQSAALQAGYQAKQNNDPIKIGYIGALRNLEIHSLPKVGQTIETEIVVENHVLDAIIINGYVWLENEMIASTEIRIFLQ